ncbi:hypothetical protein [Enterococcus sp. AZ072]|uniref:hypothetical protein n=1 Tax=unclassified Enterococcus TaxID=2608891 RepID=UPI003D29BF3F
MKDQTILYLMFAAILLNLLIPAPYCWITLAAVVMVGIILLVLALKNKSNV